MSTLPNNIENTSPRWLENLHILFWLVKDTCWALVWRPLGVIMIVPTVSVALYLFFRSRKNRSEMYHNAAVCMWIIANSTWMVGEFYNRDLRMIAVGFFATGLALLTVYYMLYFQKDRRQGNI
jgi:hypothetical protein